jgi:hypothetical protein
LTSVVWLHPCAAKNQKTSGLRGTGAHRIDRCRRMRQGAELLIHSKDRSVVTLHIHLVPVVSIIAGVLILAMPRLLNYIVAIYLILIGIAGLGLLPASAL